MRIAKIVMGELDEAHNIPGNRLIVIFEDGTFHTVLIDAVTDHVDIVSRLRVLANNIEKSGNEAPMRYH